MLTLGAWLHNLSPFALEISEGFGLRWYGLSYAAGFVVAYLLMRTLAGRGLIQIPKDRVADAMTLLILGVILGGRLGYCIFYEPALLTGFSRSFPFWTFFALNRGGMASHGGMVGVIIACVIIARGFRDDRGEAVGRTSVLHVMDVMALCATPGLFFGRIANFVNGELLGKIVAMPGESAPSWSVRFPQELFSASMEKGGHRPPLSVDQALAFQRLLDANRGTSMTDEQAYQRVLDLLQKGPAETSRRIAEQLAPLLSARHPSQLYQAFAEGIVLGVALLAIWRVPRAPGVIASWFLIIYGVLRVVTEFWRLPDAQLAVQRIAGLSRGQWLSVLMVVAGVALLRFSLVRVKRVPALLGGWGRSSGGAPA
ncbi:MAG TPA: prolipoprotein diacylglyceryl transferase [Phycisphaerales bacterium]